MTVAGIVVHRVPPFPLRRAAGGAGRARDQLVEHALHVIEGHRAHAIAGFTLGCAALENVGPGGPGTGPGAFHWLRLPFQALFLVWAWWYTRDDAVGV